MTIVVCACTLTVADADFPQYSGAYAVTPGQLARLAMTLDRTGFDADEVRNWMDQQGEFLMRVEDVLVWTAE